MGSISLDYGICTNYKEFILITKQFGYKVQHEFDFSSIKKNPNSLKEFIGIFSKERIIENKFVEKLHKESIEEQIDFTNEFYKLYHETRLMIKICFEENNLTSNEAIYYTQTFLNRLIFIFFISDRGFIADSNIFRDRILNIIEHSQCTEHTKKIYDEIKDLCIAFDKGSNVLGISGFNGGLFSGVMPEKVNFSDIKDDSVFDSIRQNSKLKKSVKLNENALKLMKKYDQLNPVIENLLIMDSFNFENEVNVNTLGHIFEQSITDLEEMNNEEISQRKKDGVFYTPEEITDYISKNTIIPLLSKSNVTTVDELIEEYKDNFEELKKKIIEIKLLDPACGSGAFLIKSTEILLDINKSILEVENLERKTTQSLEQKSITDKWDEESEMQNIIETNIYGTDINRESTEITKLSLFLKLAAKERKLIGLGKNIIMGNSLIDDNEVDPNSISWEDEFPEIISPLIENHGFDIIVGNPPYVFAREKIDQKQKEFFTKNYETSEYQLNTYILFIEKSIKLLKKGGVMGFIVPETWLKVESATKLRKFMLENTFIKKIVHRVEFPNVGAELSIFILEKTKEIGKTEVKSNLDDSDYLSFSQKTWLENKNCEINIFVGDSEKKVIEKMMLDSVKLDEISNIKAGLQEYETGKGNPKQSKEDVKNHVYDYDHKFDKDTFKYLQGVGRYHFNWNGKWLRYGKWLAAPRSFELFSSPRIIVREIPNRSNLTYQINATYIEDTYLNNRSNINILEKDKNFKLKYILAILNSRLMTFYHLKKSAKSQRDLFPKITLNDLREFPIKKISVEKQKEFIEGADNIQCLSKELYEIKNKFLRRIVENLQVEYTKKIVGFAKLSFEEFHNELKNQNIHLTLDQQDEWEDYFDKRVTEIKKIIKQLAVQNVRVDDMVHKIYDIQTRTLNNSRL